MTDKQHVWAGIEAHWEKLKTAYSSIGESIPALCALVNELLEQNDQEIQLLMQRLLQRDLVGKRDICIFIAYWGQDLEIRGFSDRNVEEFAPAEFKHTEKANKDEDAAVTAGSISSGQPLPQVNLESRSGLALLNVKSVLDMDYTNGWLDQDWDEKAAEAIEQHADLRRKITDDLALEVKTLNEQKVGDTASGIGKIFLHRKYEELAKEYDTEVLDQVKEEVRQMWTASLSRIAKMLFFHRLHVLKQKYTTVTDEELRKQILAELEFTGKWVGKIAERPTSGFNLTLVNKS